MGYARVMALDETHYLDSAGMPQAVTPQWWEDGLGAVLNRAAARFDRSGALVLTRRACELLGLPLAQLPVLDPDDPDKRRGLRDHPALEDARRAGWQAKHLGDWTRWSAPDRPSVHMAMIPALDLTPDRDGVRQANPWWGTGVWLGDAVAALSVWHAETGTPWFGAPSMTGLALMRDRAPQRGGTIPRPSYESSGMVRPEDAVEADYKPAQWRCDQDDLPYVHAYDLNRAYVGAAQACAVCPWGLKHTGRAPWDKTLAGWWRVELAHDRGTLAWGLPLPHPAGYLPGDPAVRWVTAPTVELLTELTEAGIYGGFKILDSWTGPRRDYPLRTWAEPLSKLYGRAYTRAADDQAIGDTLMDMAKAVGRKTPGALASKTSWCYRPDWWYAIVAMNRCNLFRKLKTAWTADGRLPVRIDVDCAYYASTDPDAHAALPSGYKWDPTGVRLGHVKPRATRDRSVAIGASL